MFVRRFHLVAVAILAGSVLCSHTARMAKSAHKAALHQAPCRLATSVAQPENHKEVLASVAGLVPTEKPSLLLLASGIVFAFTLRGFLLQRLAADHLLRAQTQAEIQPEEHFRRFYMRV